jgi:hypothetical protein
VGVKFEIGRGSREGREGQSERGGVVVAEKKAKSVFRNVALKTARSRSLTSA